MKQTLELLTVEMESASHLTPQFATFARTFKKEIKKEIESIGGWLKDYHRGHFCVSGFFEAPSGQLYYFSFGDIRGYHYDFADKRIMYRTAKNLKDWTGGFNQWIDLTPGFAENLSLK